MLKRKSNFDTLKGRKFDNSKEPKNIIYIFVEGQTEKSYLNDIKNKIILKKNIDINIYDSKETEHTDPSGILNFARTTIKNDAIDNYKLFLVIDGDVFNYNHIKNLVRSSNKEKSFISKPSFEFWLLLHFKNIAPVKKTAGIIAELKKYIPNYAKGKSINLALIEKNKGSFNNAMQHAKNYNNLDNATATEINLLIYELQNER